MENILDETVDLYTYNVAAPADIPSVWKMSDHYRYQWGFSIVNLYYREVAASLTVSGGDPSAVNMDNVLEAAPFTNDLPPYPYPDDEIASPRGGYAALPLNGIWASAPYLHNGSVPTLHHLLTGDRPKTFYRGNFAYELEYVGFVWDRAVDTDRAILYDTRKDGYGNAGHTGLVYNWGEDESALWELLEYLKML